MQRDLDVNTSFRFQDWKVLRFWSNEIKNNLDECVRLIEKEINLKS